MKRNNKLFIIGIAVIFIFLFLSGVAWAGWSRGDTSFSLIPTSNSQEDQNMVCTDGFMFGLGEAYVTEAPSYRFVFYKDGEDPSTDTEPNYFYVYNPDDTDFTELGQKVTGPLPEYPDTPPNPFCQDDTNDGSGPGNPPVNYCGGPYFAA